MKTIQCLALAVLLSAASPAFAGVDPATISEFQALSIRSTDAELTDFGKLFKSSGRHYEVEIRNEGEAVSALKAAYRNRLRIRFRGAGHSINGFSVPHRNELVIRSHGLRSYRFEEEGTLTVGSGPTLWEIDAFLQTRGFQLPLKNGGWSGPSVGGIISAGGIGEMGPDAPGTISNIVRSLRLIDGRGRAHALVRGGPNFNWLFGSMGQLGLITEAKLEIRRVGTGAAPYPKDEHGDIPESAVAPGSSLEKPPGNATTGVSRYWFGFFSPQGKQESMAAFLRDLLGKQDQIIGKATIFEHKVKTSDTLLPLMYPLKGDFGYTYAIFWCCSGGGDDAKRRLIGELERKIMAFALDNSVRRYAQAEYLHPGADFQRYLGRTIYRKFLGLKKRYDPRMILNAESVFPIQTAQKNSSDLVQPVQRAKQTAESPVR